MNIGLRASGSEGRLPNFLIIGAPKAGTTSLSDYLAAHPDAFVPPRKELNFFTGRWSEGIAWYREQFRKAGEVRAVGEATPSYMYREDALSRMREVVPEAKLVAILREPVARLYSDHWYRVPLGETRSFEEAIREEIRDGKSSVRQIGAIEMGRYVRHLRRVCEHFPREALLVLLMDDLRSDPEGTYSALCRHLGIEPMVRTRAVGRAKNRAYRLRWPAMRSFIFRFKLGRRLPRLAKALEAINRIPIDYPPMDAALHAELKALYVDDNAELATWLGRDLSAWA